MDWTTDSAGAGEVYPESATTEARSEQDVAAAIDNMFLEGELNPIRKTSIRRAEVAIAEKFSKGRTGLVSSIVDTLLYETTRCFDDSSRHLELANGQTTVVLLLDAKLLADEEGCSARSIQQVFQDLEECGYIHRGRGGNYDGLTGVALTKRAISDPDTRWVLSMKGKRVEGLEEWLEEARAQKRPEVRRQPQPSTAPVAVDEKTPSEAPSPSNDQPCDGSDSETPFRKRTPEISSDTYIYILNSPDVEKSCREIETTRDFSTDGPQASEQEDRWVLEIGRCIREANFRGSLQPSTLRELVASSDRLELDRPTLLKYVDCKLWELAEVRQVEYPAQTVATILRSDLKHAGAVIANLERRHQQWLQRQASEECRESQTVVEPDVNEAEAPNPEPDDSGVLEPSKVSAFVELSPWQIELRERVSSSNWTNFLSKLELVEEESERVVLEVVDGDKFTAAWIRDQLWRKVSGVFGEREVELRNVA